jgi:hypothetical protein
LVLRSQLRSVCRLTDRRRVDTPSPHASRLTANRPAFIPVSSLANLSLRLMRRFLVTNFCFATALKITCGVLIPILLRAAYKSLPDISLEFEICPRRRSWSLRPPSAYGPQAPINPEALVARLSLAEKVPVTSSRWGPHISRFLISPQRSGRLQVAEAYLRPMPAEWRRQRHLGAGSRKARIFERQSLQGGPVLRSSRLYLAAAEVGLKSNRARPMKSYVAGQRKSSGVEEGRGTPAVC